MAPATPGRPHPTSALIAPALGWLLAVAALALPTNPSEEAPRTPAPTATISATLGRFTILSLSDGRLVLFDLRGETRREWLPPAWPVLALSIDPGAAPGSREGTLPSSGEAPLIVAAAAGAREDSAILLTMKGDSGEVVSRAEIPGPAMLVLAAPGARTAYVVTPPRGAAGEGRSSRGSRWSLTEVGLSDGDEKGKIIIDGAVYAASLSPSGDRIYLAQRDTIRTFNTGPLRSSWQLRSSGFNRAIVPIGSGAGFLVARGSQIALLDPDALPGRDPKTGALPRDDAAAVIDLPFEPARISVAPDGRTASVLDAERRRLALVDLAGSRLIGVREIEKAAAAIIHPDREVVVLLGLEGENVSEMPLPHRERVASTAAPVATAAPVKESVAAAAPEPAKESPSAEPPAAQATPAPIPVVTLVEPPPAFVEPEPGRETARPPIPEPAEPGLIRGRLDGETQLVKAVVLYGPNSIIKEYARVTPAGDGSFTFPLPPPGRYRVLLAGDGGAQLICAPPYHQIEVKGEGIAGIDFKVTGRIRGSLAP